MLLGRAGENIETSNKMKHRNGLSDNTIPLAIYRLLMELCEERSQCNRYCIFILFGKQSLRINWRNLFIFSSFVIFDMAI